MKRSLDNANDTSNTTIDDSEPPKKRAKLSVLSSISSNQSIAPYPVGDLTNREFERIFNLQNNSHELSLTRYFELPDYDNNISFWQEDILAKYQLSPPTEEKKRPFKTTTCNKFFKDNENYSFTFPTIFGCPLVKSPSDLHDILKQKYPFDLPTFLQFTQNWTPTNISMSDVLVGGNVLKPALGVLLFRGIMEQCSEFTVQADRIGTICYRLTTIYFYGNKDNHIPITAENLCKLLSAMHRVFHAFKTVAESIKSPIPPKDDLKKFEELFKTFLVLHSVFFYGLFQDSHSYYLQFKNQQKQLQQSMQGVVNTDDTIPASAPSKIDSKDNDEVDIDTTGVSAPAAPFSRTSPLLYAVLPTVPHITPPPIQQLSLLTPVRESHSPSHASQQPSTAPVTPATSATSISMSSNPMVSQVSPAPFGIEQLSICSPSQGDRESLVSGNQSVPVSPQSVKDDGQEAAVVTKPPSRAASASDSIHDFTVSSSASWDDNLSVLHRGPPPNPNLSAEIRLHNDIIRQSQEQQKREQQQRELQQREQQQREQKCAQQSDSVNCATSHSQSNSPIEYGERKTNSTLSSHRVVHGTTISINTEHLRRNNSSHSTTRSDPSSTSSHNGSASSSVSSSKYSTKSKRPALGVIPKYSNPNKRNGLNATQRLINNRIKINRIPQTGSGIIGGINHAARTKARRSAQQHSHVIIKNPVQRPSSHEQPSQDAQPTPIPSQAPTSSNSHSQSIANSPRSPTTVSRNIFLFGNDEPRQPELCDQMEMLHGESRHERPISMDYVRRFGHVVAHSSQQGYVSKISPRVPAVPPGSGLCAYDQPSPQLARTPPTETQSTDPPRDSQDPTTIGVLDGPLQCARGWATNASYGSAIGYNFERTDKVSQSDPAYPPLKDYPFNLDLGNTSNCQEHSTDVEPPPHWHNNDRALQYDTQLREVYSRTVIASLQYDMASVEQLEGDRTARFHYSLANYCKQYPDAINPSNLPPPQLDDYVPPFEQDVDTGEIDRSKPNPNWHEYIEKKQREYYSAFEDYLQKKSNFLVGIAAATDMANIGNCMSIDEPQRSFEALRRLYPEHTHLVNSAQRRCDRNHKARFNKHTQKTQSKPQLQQQPQRTQYPLQSNQRRLPPQCPMQPTSQGPPASGYTSTNDTSSFVRKLENIIRGHERTIHELEQDNLQLRDKNRELSKDYNNLHELYISRGATIRHEQSSSQRANLEYLVLLREYNKDHTVDIRTHRRVLSTVQKATRNNVTNWHTVDWPARLRNFNNKNGLANTVLDGHDPNYVSNRNTQVQGAHQVHPQRAPPVHQQHHQRVHQRSVSQAGNSPRLHGSQIVHQLHSQSNDHRSFQHRTKPSYKHGTQRSRFGKSKSNSSRATSGRISQFQQGTQVAQSSTSNSNSQRASVYIPPLPQTTVPTTTTNATRVATANSTTTAHGRRRRRQPKSDGKTKETAWTVDSD